MLFTVYADGPECVPHALHSALLAADAAQVTSSVTWKPVERSALQGSTAGTSAAEMGVKMGSDELNSSISIDLQSKV